MNVFRMILHPSVGAFLRPVAAPMGGLLLFLGLRLPSDEPWALSLTFGGILLVLGGALAVSRLVLGGGRGSAADGNSAHDESSPFRERAWALLPHGLLLFAVALALMMGRVADPAFHAGKSGSSGVDWIALGQWAWVLCLLAGGVLHLFVEAALWRQRRTLSLGGPLEWHRVRWAAQAGLTLALVLLLVVVFNFAFNKVGWAWNFAYFRTTQPSEAVREVALELSEPIEVGVFFTLDSSVAPLMQGYFTALTAGERSAETLRIVSADAELKPALAERFKVRGNGWVVLRKGDTLDAFFVGDTLDRAKENLRKFDRTFFSKLLKMTRPRRTVYLTVGHGERNEVSAEKQKEGGFGEFQGMLRRRNFQVKSLGLEEGQGTALPDDAFLVVIAGPTEPFFPGELEALSRYLNQGGRLLAFLEPDGPMKSGLSQPTNPSGANAGSPPRSLRDLLARHGIGFRPVAQANDRFYGRRTFTRADHGLLFTVRFQGHPAVAALRRTPKQFPLFFLGAGALEPLPLRDMGTRSLQVQEVIRAMPGTWADHNGNFIFDALTEKRGEPLLAMAVRPGKKKPRQKGPSKNAPEAGIALGPTLFVYADADVASDLLLTRNRANRIAIETTVGWITEDGEKSASYPVTEEDVRIVHAKSDDWIWFYLPVFGVPLAVFLFGIWRVTRTRNPVEGSHG